MFMKKLDLCKPMLFRIGKVAVFSMLTLVTVVGCTATQVNTVVKDIGIYAQQAEPILLALLPIITAFSGNQQDATTAASLNSFAGIAKVDLDALSNLCNDYAASPDASTYQRIGAAVDKLVIESDASLLQIAGIKDPVSRRRVQLAIASFDALIHTIDGFVQTTQTSSGITAKAQQRSLRLQQISTYWSREDQQNIARAFGTSYPSLLHLEEQRGF